jgi:hypothetical protein
MPDSAPSFLSAWSNFYVMTGSAAAALTGLMFVVITLVTGERTQTTRDGLATFSTPTVLHFGAVLLISAILCAPWHSLPHVAVLMGLSGLIGLGYAARIAFRASKLSSYKPDLEDWICYTVLPLLAYATILGAGIGLSTAPANALFALAGAVILLIFTGIHNAWDVVTFVTIKDFGDKPASSATSSRQ